MADDPWVAIGGDVVVHGPVRRPDNEALWRRLAAAETAFVNLEAPLTRHDEPVEKVVTLRCDPAVSGELAALGIDAVTLANNHSLDHGPAGLAETFAVLDAAGVETVGAGPDEQSATAPLVRQTASGTVALFGFACTLPAGFAAGERRAGVAPIRVRQQVSVDPALVAEQPGSAPFVHTVALERDVERACSRIAAARAEADLVVVAVHWGVPPGWAARSNGVLATYQRPLAHRLVDAGADIVAGHHPHVVHPLEIYRDALVAYSLGNFVFQSWSQWAPGRDSNGFQTEVAMAPYENPFGNPATLESIVILVHPSSAGVSCDFVPTLLVGDGTPVLSDRARAGSILDRLTPPAPAGDAATPRCVRVDDPELGAVARLHLDVPRVRAGRIRP